MISINDIIGHVINTINMIKRDNDYDEYFSFFDDIKPYKISEFKSLEEIERFNKNSETKIQYNKKELKANTRGENKGFIPKEIRIHRNKIRQVWYKQEIKEILRADNGRDKIVYPCYTDIKNPSTLVFLVKIIK